MRARFWLATWLATVLVILGAGAARADRTHLIAPGETLSAIGKHYGCSVAELRRANQLAGDDLTAGDNLDIPTCDAAPAAAPGPARVKLVAGQSIGRPWRGRLAHPAELPDGKGYHIRRPWRRYGASHVVAYIQRAIAESRRRFPKAHVLAVGDLSQKRGGEITDHHSHQSGRDVDIGLYYKKIPNNYPDSFVIADESNLDCEKTLGLIEAFARSHDKAGGVQMIFLDFHVQEILVEWAHDHGVDDDHLAWLFQAPHGRGSSAGIVRHEPNHADHFHVRFQCPPDDRGCG
jgi:murein endopeptidase